MKSPFQTIVLGIFIVAFIVAVIAFSGILSSGDQAARDPNELSGTVVVWGVLPNEAMQQYIVDLNASNDYQIVYQEVAPADFYQRLIVALADGVQPDVVIISSEIFSQFKDKLYRIPFAAYDERAFRDTNIDGAQIFLANDGVIAMPLLVDPLVVYYNKDLLAGRNFVVPPTTWTTLAQSISGFVRRDTQGVLSQVGIGLGSAENITHFRDILSALFLQTGNSLVVADEAFGSRVTLAEGGVSGEQLPTAQALTFFTGFANPTNRNYSWNRNLPSDKDMFLAGRSVFYIGRASELFTIQSQNPNLNFDVVQFFQSDQAIRPVTFGSFIATATLKNAPNFAAGYDAMTKFANLNGIDSLSKKFSIPPVRRDLLMVSQQNPYVSVFFRSALSAFAWPDPNPITTVDIFRAMITNVNSGASDPDTAIYEASRDLQSSIR